MFVCLFFHSGIFLRDFFKTELEDPNCPGKKNNNDTYFPVMLLSFEEEKKYRISHADIYTPLRLFWSYLRSFLWNWYRVDLVNTYRE